MVGLHRLLVRISFSSGCGVAEGSFGTSSGVDDATWYTTENGWAELAYHTSDTGCGGTNDYAFEAPLCS